MGLSEKHPSAGRGENLHRGGPGDAWVSVMNSEGGVCAGGVETGMLPAFKFLKEVMGRKEQNGPGWLGCQN